MDDLLLLFLPKEIHQKNTKGTRMFALRVPCDAKSGLLGKSERDFKNQDQRPKTKDQRPNIHRHSGMFLAGIQLFILSP